MTLNVINDKGRRTIKVKYFTHCRKSLRVGSVPAPTRVIEELLKIIIGHVEMKTLLLRISFLKDEKAKESTLALLKQY